MPAPFASETATNFSSGSVQKDRETIIIFDWDDTLLSSSFLSGQGLRLDTDKSNLTKFGSALEELETSVISLIMLALSFGSVHIITNAETGWVELSCNKFLPRVAPYLKHVQVVSARSTFEGNHPNSPIKWKYCAFQQRLAALFSASHKQKNVLSFGDSHVEREAIRAVTKGAPNTNCKSVKFAERPTIEQLRRQIELVSNCFTYIHNHEGDLDLQLTVTVNNNAGNNVAEHFLSSSCDQEVANEVSHQTTIASEESKPIQV